MDAEKLELLLRPTSFCSSLLMHTWDNLNSSERITLMLHLTKKNAVPKDLMTKALEDSNPIIRMLAIKGSPILDDVPELYSDLKNDESLFVRAAMNSKLLYDLEDLMSLNHDERLGVIALSEGLSETKFAKFIYDGIQNRLISEEEATQLINEFVRNPNLHKGIRREAYGGMDWHTKKEGFEAIWSLTTCTSYSVHSTIADEYPLNTGSNDTIPEKILSEMEQETLETIARRGCEPLLKLIKNQPEKFGEKIKEAAQNFEELGYRHKMEELTEFEELHDELIKLRSEIKRNLNSISEQIAELMARRRSLFG